MVVVGAANAAQLVAHDHSAAWALLVARVPAEEFEPFRLGAKFVVAFQAGVAFAAAKVGLDLGVLRCQLDLEGLLVGQLRKLGLHVIQVVVDLLVEVFAL